MAKKHYLKACAIDVVSRDQAIDMSVCLSSYYYLTGKVPHTLLLSAWLTAYFKAK
ncbi:MULTISPECIES: hypothetical protein [Enterobacteriaceae]|uniref:hypothetical protein n=1 Tax=Enterobacteriaceae TaxID=543 RepID=UPI001A1FE818|nr:MULTISPECIES: hypothetical protein [Klebsiella]QUE99354.1 hypothetical protein KCG39_27460 [Klebsiella pasteurii]GKO93645.1 hypothetical protein NUBL17186_46880 [Klebsiella quasipneumoniae]HAT3652290.1 hypothetical protein [Raoultella ornithinolytica]HCI9061443.1 hypothetical protein [Klebsiella quasipneumoniae]